MLFTGLVESLSGLHLADNPLELPPASVIEQGTQVRVFYDEYQNFFNQLLYMTAFPMTSMWEVSWDFIRHWSFKSGCLG